MLTATYALLFYAATVILVVGLGRKIWQYANTPAPLKIPTTPAPVTQGGVVARMFREVVLFESLFKANKWTWLFGWTFHAALLVVLIRHTVQRAEQSGLAREGGVAVDMLNMHCDEAVARQVIAKVCEPLT